MVAFKIQGFGGRQPALDDRLLPDTAASSAFNTWLYNGDLQGTNGLTLLRACTGSAIGKAFRIPNNSPTSAHFADSVWLEFQNPDTDVVRSPVLGDSFDRYYWAAPNIAPSYNTLARIKSSSAAFLLGITPPGAMAVSALDTNAPPTRTGNTHSSTTIDSLSSPTSDLAVGDTVTGSGVVASPPTTITAIPTTTSVTLNQATVTTLTTTPFTFGTNGLTVSRAYVCTWVSAYGEESAPSTPVVVNAPNTFVWNVTLPATDPNDLGVNRNLVSVNIYRTVTSSAGVATYFLVTTLPIATTTYADSLTDVVVSANVQLPSTTWTPPPSDLVGFQKLPNGSIAGFRKNEIWFCEPFRPHAWPAAYALVVDYPIVGLGVVDQTLVVCTTVYPIVISGSHPSNMSPRNLSALEPCLTRASVLSTTEGVYYVSPNGLVLISYNGANVVTKDIIRKDKWANLVPTQTLRAARLQNAYYGFGVQRPASFYAGGFDNASFMVTTDNTDAFTGVLIDMTVPRVAFVPMTSTPAMVNIYNDPWSGEVFVIHDNNVYWLNLGDPSPTLNSYKWRSKSFQMGEKKNLGALRIYFEVPANTPAQNVSRDVSNPQTWSSGKYGVVRVFADGVSLIEREIRTSGELMRIPSGVKADFWQVEIEGVVRVFSVQIAASAKELQQV